jgi:hypothetical protein
LGVKTFRAQPSPAGLSPVRGPGRRASPLFRPPGLAAAISQTARPKRGPPANHYQSSHFVNMRNDCATTPDQHSKRELSSPLPRFFDSRQSLELDLELVDAR